MPRTRNRVARRERREAARQHDEMIATTWLRKSGGVSPGLTVPPPPPATFDNGWERWHCSACLKAASAEQWIAQLVLKDGSVKDWGPQNGIEAAWQGTDGKHRIWFFPQIAYITLRGRDKKDGTAGRPRKAWVVLSKGYRLYGHGTYRCSKHGVTEHTMLINHGDGDFIKVLNPAE